MKCGECGKKFQTPSRNVQYCSTACSNDAGRRRARAYTRERGGTASAPAPAPAAGKCRACGKRMPASKSGPPRAYCSPACRAEGARAHQREYKRRYLADPERRSLHAARMRASYVRRRAATAKDRIAECRECGKAFRPYSMAVAYCSNPCRKKARARLAAAWERAYRSRGGADAAGPTRRRA